MYLKLDKEGKVCYQDPNTNEEKTLDFSVALQIITGGKNPKGYKILFTEEDNGGPSFEKPSDKIDLSYLVLKNGKVMSCNDDLVIKYVNLPEFISSEEYRGTGVTFYVPSLQRLKDYAKMFEPFKDCNPFRTIDLDEGITFLGYIKENGYKFYL